MRYDDLPMRPGLGSFALTWAVGVDGATSPTLGALELVDEAAALGAEVLQLGDNVAADTLAGEELRTLRDRAAEAGLELELGGRGLTHEALDRHVAVADALGARILRFVVDAPGYEPAAETVAAVLRDRAAALEHADVTLALENHDRFPVRELAALVRAVDSRHVGVCLDTVNSIGSGEGLGEALTALAPLTVNLHVKDFRIRRRPHGMGFVVEGARLGDGMLDLDAVIDAVDRHGRCTTAVLEQWAPELPSLPETVALEREWARTGTTVLRNALARHRSNPRHQGEDRTP
jgi:3-oxoisoapionate decarboxylase